jgi:hypothetical protein
MPQLIGYELTPIHQAPLFLFTMPVSYEYFRLLPFEQQLPLIWVEGTFPNS